MMLPQVKRSAREPARRKTPPSSHFDVNQHRDALFTILKALEELVVPADSLTGALNPRDIERVLKQNPRDGRGLFSRSQLLSAFRALAPQASWAFSEREFAERIRLRPIRTRSGVTPVTVLTRPFPCPGRCIFCPNDVRMPKSYLSDEPGAQRAEDNNFDPYLQTWGRLKVFWSIGHPTDKIELIILGGTWSSYPPTYQRWFIKRCFDALNDFGNQVDSRADVAQSASFETLPRYLDFTAPQRAYNAYVSEALRAQFSGVLARPEEDASWDEIETSHQRNTTNTVRCVGLVVETRPDHVTESEVVHLRRLGCTKVQLGYQSLSDAVLDVNQRGHDVAASRRATALLRAAGFKVHAHWMFNLLGGTPASDCEDFALMFEDTDFRPDELKVYPCSLIESAELMSYYRRNAWRPYTREELLEVLTFVLRRTPRYCRLTRVVRDIPAGDIVVGNKQSNLREVAEACVRDSGHAMQDIRYREVRNSAFDRDNLNLKVTCYSTAVGEEAFIEWVTPEDRIAAFLRLSLPDKPSFVAELQASAIIREVHVYGSALSLGERQNRQAQHQGLGRKLIAEAGRRSHSRGFTTLAVISAVGTREYYRKLGFEDGPLYQHQKLVHE